jgi:hypothetical protein
MSEHASAHQQAEASVLVQVVRDVTGAWKDSPTGTFVNWHTNVSCDAFSGHNP